MTLIDKAEALAILAPAPNSKDGLWAKRKKALHDAIAALPARGVGVRDNTLIAEKANDAREVFSSTCDTAKQAIDYLEQLILAALPTDAAHVNVAPKSEHDAGNVLTDAAQAREAAQAWAVFDPNWGEPVPLLATIRETAEEAIEAALVTKERGTSLYSGYADRCVPPIKGEWWRLTNHGYFVSRVSLINEARDD